MEQVKSVYNTLANRRRENLFKQCIIYGGTKDECLYKSQQIGYAKCFSDCKNDLYIKKDTNEFFKCKQQCHDNFPKKAT